MTNDVLFTPDERRRFDRLRIRRRRAVPGERIGEWRSARLGAGGSFADYREYVPGDDLRTVDWNVYGRLGDLVVKRFEAQENLDVVLCVDRSASMAGAKARAARRLAAALGRIALGHSDHVRVAWLPAPGTQPLSLFRGRDAAAALFDELGTVSDGGPTDLQADLARALSAFRGRGVAMVLSDFYDPVSAVAGLRRARARRLEVAAFHLLDPHDVELPPGGSVRAVDRETGQAIDVDVTPAFLDALRETWRRRAEAVERWCVAREIPYQHVDPARSLWDLIPELVRRGLVAGSQSG